MEVDCPDQRAFDQIADLYKHCIRLSASNKINAKNAFVLKLIDFMHDLVNQDGEQTNFKIASGALDVCAKIYSHRVDCVHSEAQKVASSILMALEGKNHKNNTSNNNEDDSKLDETIQDGADLNNSDENCEEGETNRVKKKSARQRNMKNVTHDHTTLDGKFEKDFPGQIYLDELSREYDISYPAALILAHPKNQISCLVSIDSDAYNSSNSRVRPHEDSKMREAQTQMDPRTISMENPSTQPTTSPARLVNISTNCAQTLIDNKNLPVCSKLENFLFLDLTSKIKDFNPDESNVFDSGENNIGQNAPNQEEPKEGENRFQSDLYGNNDIGDDYDMGDCGADNSDSNLDSGKNNPLPNMDLIGAGAPDDYRYENEPRLKDTWAGPHAWKSVKQQTIKAEPGMVPKSARKRIKLEPKEINFADPVNISCTDVADKDLRLSSDSIKRWKKVFVPQDHNLDSDVVKQKLIQLSLRPEEKYSFVKQHKSSTSIPDGALDQTLVNGFDADIPHSPPMAFDDYHDDSDDEFRADPLVEGNQVALFGSTNQTLTQNADLDNFIDQPFSVAQAQITYAKTAKKMDIRRLKRAMWDLLLPPERREIMNETVLENPAAPESDQIRNRVTFGDQGDVTVPEDEVNISNGTVKSHDTSFRLNFSDLYGELPHKINPKMAHDLSHPIAFVTLLHLANEKNLRLIPKPDLSDFSIEIE